MDFLRWLVIGVIGLVLFILPLYILIKGISKLVKSVLDSPSFEIWYRTPDGSIHKHWFVSGEPDCIDKAIKLAEHEPDYEIWVLNTKTNEIVWKF